MTVVDHRSRLRDTQAALWIIGLTLAGCASAPAGPPPEPKIEVQKVNVAVITSCVSPDYSPTPPDFADTDAKLKGGAGPEDRFQALVAAHRAHFVYEAGLREIIRICQVKSTP